MKIKKMFQGSIPENKILNTYSDSQTDTYSCDYLNKRGMFIKATNSSEQTITTKTTYTMKFDTEYINTSDCLSLSNNEIVIGKGVSSVLVSGRYSTSGGYTFQKYIYIFKNNVQYAYKMESSAQTLDTSTVIDVVEGDHIIMKVYHERGSDAVVTMAPQQTHLQATVI